MTQKETNTSANRSRTANERQSSPDQKEQRGSAQKRKSGGENRKGQFSRGSSSSSKKRASASKQRKPAHSQVSVGQEVTLTIRRLGINGEGIGYFKKQVVFVDGALPGEVVICDIVSIEPKFATARLKKIRQASPDRVQPPCPVYSSCGGCQLQHLAYEAQLREKKSQVVQAFERYTSYTSETLPIKDTVGMDNPWGYRNKGQLQVGKIGNQVIAGLYKQGSHELIDLSECAVQHPKTNEVIQKTKAILQKLNIPIYNERKRTGVVRTIVTRIGFETGQLQLVLVTRTREIPHLRELLIELRINEGYAPDVIVVDPPRTGCDDQLLRAIIQAKPKRLVYVSCNPSSLAKDCKQLLEAGFGLKEVKPFDMFPHTSHVECVILMVRKEL